MTDEELAATLTAPSGARRIEAGAFLYAVRPIAADMASMLFFYAVLSVTGDVRTATVTGMVLGACQVAVLVARRQAVPPMLTASTLLVVSLGGLTLWLNDPRFVLVQASIVYVVIGGTMLSRGWMARYLPPIVAGRVPASLITAFGFAWAALILGTGVLNAALTFTVPPRTVAAIILPWAVGSKLVLFAIQYALFRRTVRRHIIATIAPLSR